MQDLGVTSYGIGVTTMEEVFLRVAKEQHEQDEAEEGSELSEWQL